MEEQISATTSERNLAISCKVKVTLHPSNSKHTCVRRRTLPTKFHVVKAMVFSVVMYGCESWSTKRVSAEELMLFLQSPLYCKKIKPVNPKENQS